MKTKLIALIALAVAALAGDKPAPAPEVAAFLQWYDAYSGSFFPQDVMRAYTEQLAKRGVAKPEIDRRLGVVQAAIRSMPVEFTSIHFNKIYAAPNPPFRQEPSQVLIRIAGALKPGAALDVAMGQGRNALYLAGKGWDVTGYDLSTQGLRMANDAARKDGVPLKTVRASHDEFDYGKDRWDLIVETYAFTNLEDAAYRRRAVDSLKKGGVLLIEGFGGPKNSLLEAFRDLRVLYYEDREDVADWGMQKSRLTRIAVQKD
jgi:2-polyprenyl-3-methyl-5-hydroxy-6-metoxy-1,4-benzoquinol methylase